MLSSTFNWILGLTGVAGLGWVALAIFAPSVLSVVASWLKALSPIVEGIANALVEFFKIMWEGLKDVADNLSTVIFVLVMCLISYFYGLTSQVPKLIKGPVEVIREYKNKPKRGQRKTSKPRVVLPQKKKQSEDWKSWMRVQ